ncbi:MAG: hypothetical protein JOY73_07345 [Actinobacteria bacterium]|nr:hypothetical protein [Actinomycetota bacterium]
MAQKPTQKPDKPAGQEHDEQEFVRFESLLKRVLRVPKAEVDKLRKRDK